ncbi:MAG: hypothetical protein K0R66_842 [Gammaproteobacteria bacterium]|jgi:hypothetical protein|nr:hypothetical protein [Gammaproteobacteria bacterium]
MTIMQTFVETTLYAEFGSFISQPNKTCLKIIDALLHHAGRIFSQASD